MTRAQRITNLAAVVVPFLAVPRSRSFCCGTARSAGRTSRCCGALHPRPASASPWASTACSRTAPSRPASRSSTGSPILGSMAVQGPVIHWVADHRKHHAHTDEEGDPHSPHVGAGHGPARADARAHRLAHDEQGRAARRKYAPDLMRGPGHALHQPQLRVLGSCSAWRSRSRRLRSYGFTLRGALIALVWAGLVRIFLLHHVTWSINSVCHFYGSRRFAPRTTRRTSPGSRCPRSASPGTTTTTRSRARRTRASRRWELDLSALVISRWSASGLIWNVVRDHARAPGAEAGTDCGCGLRAPDRGCLRPGAAIR